MSSHGPCVAALSACGRGEPAARPACRLAVSMAPMTATPRTLPNWRVTEMTADATPACDGGMPVTPVLVIGGLTRPRPAPSTAMASASHG